MTVGKMRIGVLALQGDVREHLEALRAAGADAVAVRRAEELPGLHGLVIPGGESTTISQLAERWGLLEPIRALLRAGLPAYGSCAGMVLLADRILDGTRDQQQFGGLDVVVRRNAFGRQVHSFEAEVAWEGGPLVPAVFIRAPWVEELGAGVDVLARVGSGPAQGRVVAVRSGPLLATSFHPELTGDLRVHRYFVDMVTAAVEGGFTNAAVAAPDRSGIIARARHSGGFRPADSGGFREGDSGGAREWDSAGSRPLNLGTRRTARDADDSSPV